MERLILPFAFVLCAAAFASLDRGPPARLSTGMYRLSIGSDGLRGTATVLRAAPGRPLGVEFDLPGFEPLPSFNQPLGREGWTIMIAPGSSALSAPRYTLVVAASAQPMRDALETNYCVRAVSSSGKEIECSMTWRDAWDDVALRPPEEEDG